MLGQGHAEHTLCDERSHAKANGPNERHPNQYAFHFLLPFEDNFEWRLSRRGDLALRCNRLARDLSESQLLGIKTMSYADETEYAVRQLIELAVREEELLAEKLPALAEKERQMQIHQRDFETSDLNDDFPDSHVMAAFGRAARAGKEVSALSHEIATLQSLIGAHQMAVQAICGALLQIAKQGISLVHGGMAKAPAGRDIGGVSLRDVIWQARNQSLHHEEGRPKEPVVSVFASLERTYGPAFSLTLHARQNRAKQVVDLLRWRTYDSYLGDARSLGL